MADIKTIDLEEVVKPALPWLSFLRAEWWDDSSRFVLIRYSLKGKEQELGLRLDLDKRVFLDHLDDPELDMFVQYQVENIWRVVALKRLPPRFVPASPRPRSRSRPRRCRRCRG